MRRKFKNNRGQVGIEYLMMVGFVTIAVIAVLGIAMVYSERIKDSIRINQVESFATQLINSAESVFFSGEPSKTSVSLYLPEGVEQITFESEGLVFEVRTSTGLNVLLFESSVPLSGSIPSVGGVKKLTLTAQTSSLFISS